MLWQSNIDEIDNIVEKPNTTVQYIIANFRIAGEVGRLDGSGKSKQFAPSTMNKIARSIKEYPKIFVVAIAKELEKAFIAKVLPQTVRTLLLHSIDFDSKSNHLVHVVFGSLYVYLPTIYMYIQVIS